MLSNNKQNQKNVLVTAHSKPAIPFSESPLDIRTLLIIDYSCKLQKPKSLCIQVNFQFQNKTSEKFFCTLSNELVK